MALTSNSKMRMLWYLYPYVCKSMEQYGQKLYIKGTDNTAFGTIEGIPMDIDREYLVQYAIDIHVTGNYRVYVLPEKLSREFGKHLFFTRDLMGNALYEKDSRYLLDDDMSTVEEEALRHRFENANALGVEVSELRALYPLV